jgi:hypothetical protein
MVNNGGLPILAARGRLKPEVMSTFDTSTTVSRRSILKHAPFESYTRFSVVNYGGMSISTARGRLK